MKFSKFLILSVILSTVACTSSDDDYEQIINTFDVDDLISIPNESETYNLNDTLYVELNIPFSLITEEGETVNVQELVPNANYAELALYRYKAEDTERNNPIPFTSSEVFLASGNGRLLQNGIGVALAALKKSDKFEGRLGIKLKTAGDFYLAPYKQTSTDVFYTMLQDPKTFDILQFTTSIENQMPSNRFAFSVTEE